MFVKINAEVISEIFDIEFFFRLFAGKIDLQTTCVIMFVFNAKNKRAEIC